MCNIGQHECMQQIQKSIKSVQNLQHCTILQIGTVALKLEQIKIVIIFHQVQSLVVCVAVFTVGYIKEIRI